jgi:fucose 4-O-acetylase-like acetyltransferase
VIPYIACCIAHYCLFGGESPDMNALMKQYLFGMFQTSAVFTDVGGVGYIYFVPMILATRLIYTLVDWITFKIEILKAAAVFALTACGIWLSSQGLWLPWSFDVSLYCLIFYWAGEQLHQYKVLQYLAARPYYYFILALIWVYGISTGQLEIAVRSYAPYLEVIAGAVAGTLAVYLASVHIARYWPIAATWLLKELGQATIYILIIHTLFKNPLIEYLGQWYDPAQMDNLFRAVPIQLGAGLAIWLAVKLLRTVFKCITRPLRKEKRKEKESVELRLQNRFE